MILRENNNQYLQYLCGLIFFKNLKKEKNKAEILNIINNVIVKRLLKANV